MRKAILLLALVAQSIAWIGCKSYAKYPIDEQPNIPVDENLLGIWKAVEDTNKKDYIFIQRTEDMLGVEKNDDKQPSYWQSSSLVTPNISYVENKKVAYYISRMSNGGRRPLYQQFGAFMSEVKGEKFLNIRYAYVPRENDQWLKEKAEEGYFFVRIISLNKNADTLTTCIVADKIMVQLKSSKEVRKRIAKNLKKPAFYSDTLHFYKASPFHGGLKESRDVANMKR